MQSEIAQTDKKEISNYKSFHSKDATSNLFSRGAGTLDICQELFKTGLQNTTWSALRNTRITELSK